jgi:phospholipid/cholesterol/gamma-HCH transport system substrate-binding protein
MAENPSEVIAGSAVLAAALAFVIYAGQSTGFTRDPGSYPLTASFRSVDGVSIGTEVRLAGVKIGTVTDLSLNPKTFFADATFSVRDDIQVPEDSTALISSEGLLGGNFLEIQPGGSPDNIAPGGEIVDTQGAVGLISLLMKFVGSASADSPAPAQ